MLHELTIYQKHYDLMLYAIPLINKYPKSQRYVVGQQTMNLMLDIAYSSGWPRPRTRWATTRVHFGRR